MHASCYAPATLALSSLNFLYPHGQGSPNTYLFAAPLAVYYYYQSEVQ